MNSEVGSLFSIRAVTRVGPNQVIKRGQIRLTEPGSVKPFKDKERCDPHPTLLPRTLFIYSHLPLHSS